MSLKWYWKLILCKHYKRPFSYAYKKQNVFLTEQPDFGTASLISKKSFNLQSSTSNDTSPYSYTTLHLERFSDLLVPDRVGFSSMRSIIDVAAADSIETPSILSRHFSKEKDSCWRKQIMMYILQNEISEGLSTSMF